MLGLPKRKKKGRKEGERNEHKNSFDSLDNAWKSHPIHENCKHVVCIVNFCVPVQTWDKLLHTCPLWRATDGDTGGEWFLLFECLPLHFDLPMGTILNKLWRSVLHRCNFIGFFFCLWSGKRGRCQSIYFVKPEPDRQTDGCVVSSRARHNKPGM